MRAIGQTQKRVMDELCSRGKWTAQSEWTAHPDMGYNEMRKTLERLVSRGLVVKQRQPQTTKQGQRSYLIVYLPAVTMVKHDDHPVADLRKPWRSRYRYDAVVSGTIELAYERGYQAGFEDAMKVKK